MTPWEHLFVHALCVADAAPVPLAWTLGGGSALMVRHRHRHTAGVDLFVRDERALSLVAPGFNDAAAELPASHVEQSDAVRLYFAQGEVAFIAAPSLTSEPLRRHSILGRSVRVESSGEVLARKFWHRAATLPARDLFDFAAVAALEPDALQAVGGVLRARRAALLARLREDGDALREDFAALHAWEFNPGFEEAVAALRNTIERSVPPRAFEEQRPPYVLPGTANSTFRPAGLAVILPRTGTSSSR